jgi:hypothetical protein
MATDPRQGLTDFGFDLRGSPYHFALVVERDAATVRLEERFALDAEGTDPDTGQPHRPVIKATLDAYRWSRLSEPARAEFNRRITAEGGRAARWRPAETLLAPHLGKELTLLFWVVEDADPTVIPNMVANWTGLAPEERWWLYTTVNATAGHPDYGRERGWRKAVKIALAENPAATTTPGGWLTRVDVDKPEPPPRRQQARGRKPAPAASDQLSLLPDDPPAQLPLIDESAPGSRDARP